ncbi:MAG: hypothetical protein V2I54_03600 [Bacteroidales bacterium]|jgi:hypothetical protein|nr:hypothetical protein [Bacteroidales bacterium]
MKKTFLFLSLILCNFLVLGEVIVKNGLSSGKLERNFTENTFKISGNFELELDNEYKLTLLKYKLNQNQFRYDAKTNSLVLNNEYDVKMYNVNMNYRSTSRSVPSFYKGYLLGLVATGLYIYLTEDDFPMAVALGVVVGLGSGFVFHIFGW